MFNALQAWVRWEVSRRIQLTVGLRLIVLDRYIKAVVLLIGGVVLIIVTASGGIQSFTDQLQTQLNLEPGKHLWLRLVDLLAQRFTRLSHTTEIAVAVAAILYGLLEAVEGTALLMRRRWAEYLVLLATAAFIPLEVDELIRHPTVLKGLAFAVNVAIVVYLIRRKRLFIDRMPQAVA
jgi:uncharacterized membrane protein (DUF2068 family)